MVDEKFILLSRGIIGGVTTILLQLGLLGYINFTQAQADAWTVIGVTVLSIVSAVVGVWGRYKANTRLTIKK